MWITSEVDLPSELVTAHNDGRLVLFVGAGASKPSPSDLPLFDELTDLVYAQAVQPMLPQDRESGKFDVALGRLKADHDVDVHTRIGTIIGDDQSKPNDLHRALLDLAMSARCPRIVTTNYDLHLSSGVGATLARSDAPALPMGDDFDGIVHLHGSLAKAARHLIVTDEDFGRAYLRDAWAARFLERMFREFEVLFVGYSHSDVVMTYFGRALPRNGTRYALTDKPDSDHWRLLGITPIGYPTVGSDHSALTRAIAAWARESSLGLLDHKSRIEQYVKGPVPLDPHDLDYLSTIFDRAETTRFFTAVAETEDWLRWASGQPAFRDLVVSTANGSDVQQDLAGWLASKFAMDSALADAAHEVLARAGSGLSRVLWCAIAQQLHARDDVSPPVFEHWVAVLVSDIPVGVPDYLGWILTRCKLPEHRNAALLLIEAVLRPALATGRRFGRSVEFAGEEYAVREAWAGTFRPNLTDLAAELLPILVNSILRASTLLRAAGQAGIDFDTLSYGRSAIEDHPQDRHREPADNLIDALRDTIECMQLTEPAFTAQLTTAWAQSTSPVLRRLAVHAWTERPDVNSDEKLNWLLSTDLLFQAATKHEIFRFLGSALPTASVQFVEQLSERIDSQRILATEDWQLFEVYNILEWVSRLPNAEPVVRGQLDDLRAAHPEWSPREHPDLDHYVTGGAFTEPQPMATDELHAALLHDARETVEHLSTFQANSSPFTGPTWAGTMGLVASVVAAHPDDAFTLLGLWSDSDPAFFGRDIERAALQGLANSALTAEMWGELLPTLLGLPALAALVEDVARLLETGARNSDSPIPHSQLATARELAQRLWVIGPQDEDPGLNEPLTYAIGHWAGQLAEFWLHSISLEWKSLDTEWVRLSEPTEIALSEMIRDATTKGIMARTVFASQLHFLFAADEDWAIRNALPLLDFDRDQPDATRCWDGFLTWGRWSNRLLSRGLLASYVGAIGHLGSLPNERRDQFFEHLASIALFGEAAFLDTGWTDKLLSAANDRDLAVWTRSVASMVSEGEPEFADAEWTRWMRAHYRQRASGLPRKLAVLEASALASWALNLRDSYGESTLIAVSTNARIEPHSSLLHKMQSEGLGERDPEATARFLSRLLTNTPKGEYFDCYHLQPIVRAVAGHVPPVVLKQLIEAALPLCADAPGWVSLPD